MTNVIPSSVSPVLGPRDHERTRSRKQANRKSQAPERIGTGRQNHLWRREASELADSPAMAMRRAFACAFARISNTFVKALGKRLASENIRVNALCPGPIDTPMLRVFVARPDQQSTHDGFVAKFGRSGELSAYAVSYRDLEAMMTEHGVAVDHCTIYRWVQRFAPEMEKRLRWQWRRPRSRSWCKRRCKSRPR